MWKTEHLADEKIIAYKLIDRISKRLRKLQFCAII